MRCVACVRACAHHTATLRYENTVEVDPRVYKCVEKFRRVDATGKRKQGGDQLFESFDAQDLNKELKNIMDGLSVKVCARAWG